MGVPRQVLTVDEIIIAHIASMRSYADSLEDGWPLVSRAKVVARVRKCAGEVERAHSLAKNVATARYDRPSQMQIAASVGEIAP